MLRNISKVVLASFLFTGAAKAALIYNDDTNRFTVDVKAEMYATHDRYGFQKKGDGRTTGPVELVGNVTIDNFYTKKFNNDFSAMTYLKMCLPVFGYSSGAYGSSKDEQLNNYMSTFTIIDKANLNINHTYMGSFTIGRYKSFFGELLDYSDVEIFLGNPAMETKSSLIFGGSVETGIAYSKSMANNALVLGISIDGAKDTLPFAETLEGFKIEDEKNESLSYGYILKKDFKVAGKAQYNITDEFMVGAVYNLAGFRIDQVINSGNNYITTIKAVGRDIAHTALAGINYNNRGTSIGVTGNYQYYDFKIDKAMKFSEQVFGIEAGLSYDISGVEVGFRPNIQYDYQRSYTNLKRSSSQEMVAKSEKDSSTKKHKLNVHAIELGLSYYVNPSFYYVAAAVVDLRTSKEVAEVANIDSSLVKKKHYVGVGVVYKF